MKICQLATTIIFANIYISCVIFLQAMATSAETGATGCRLWPRQEQTHGEQKSQREKSREEGVRESHPTPVSCDRRT